MKFTLEYSGDTYEDQDELSIIYHAKDMYSAIIDANNFIRNRLKYGENIDEREEKSLQHIREILYVEGIEL